MEIHAFTIAYSKKKTTRKRHKESILLSEMMKLRTKLQKSYGDSLKAELERKFQLSKIAGMQVSKQEEQSCAVGHVGTSMVRGIVSIFIT